MIRSTFRHSNLLLTRLAVALGACIAAGQLYAQQATGSIFGQASSGASVTLENLDTGSKRSIAADGEGRFRFSQLPTGRYKVTTDAGSRDASVNVGTGTEVNFVSAATGTSLGTVTVTANAVNPIDVSSVESTTVFTAQQLAVLPVAHDITNVALLAPGTVKGDPGFGNLASFGGSSVAENGYYINGFDVTNLHTFQSYFTLPFNAIAQEQVKTGGYGAEYGRSLGGVINIVTERGSNDWRFGGAAFWEPDALRSQGPNVRNPNGQDYVIFDEADKQNNVTYNAYLSGPLVRDKLFIYAMVEGQSNTRDDFNPVTNTAYGMNLNARSTVKTPHAFVKLDWNISDHHLLEFTGISSHDRTTVQTYDNGDALWSTKHLTPSDRYTDISGGDLYVAKYTGYLTDSLTLSAQYGQFKMDNYRDPRNLPGADCPWVLDGRTVGNGATGDLVPEGCYNQNNITISDPKGENPYDKRRAGRLDLEWKLGSHTLRGGFDGEKFTSTDLGYTYTGGVYWRYYVYLGGKVNGVTPPAGTTEYVRARHVSAASGKYQVDNTAAYIEDTWQFNDRWMFYAGLREETFDNKDALGRSTVKSSNQLAPRLGFSWDMTGDSANKLFGTLGRYYIPVASNTNIRASRAETFVSDFYTFTGQDARTGAPITLGQHLGSTVVSESGVIPSPGQYAATNLKPMYQDELILGFQHAFAERWSAGASTTIRKVGAGMDDYCWAGAFDNWAADHGYTNFDDSTLPSCMLLNPGRDNAFKLDLNGDGKLTNVTIPAKYFMVPKYKRRYNAIELFVEKQWDENWYAHASYTWSHDYGNAEGYVDSNFQQGDAGTTADFDYPSFTDGINGNLPNDHRHVFKLFGAYKPAPNWIVSGNLLVESGGPISCIGFLPLTGPEGSAQLASINQSYGPSSNYCNAGADANGDAIQKLVQRGTVGRTPWIKSLDVGVKWSPQIDGAKLTFGMDVFNLLNDHNAVRVSMTHDTNAGNPQTVNTFGLTTDYQQPRYVRFSARMDF
ncbi:MAG TPA: TonB-dependent receptor [Rudaea sp.]